MEQKLNRAMFSAVGSLLDTMIPVSYSLAQDASLQPGPHLLGSIQVQGRMLGSLVIALPTPLAIFMTGRMLDEVIDEVNDDVYEMVAEMINIVAGGVKTTFSESNHEAFLLGLPQVLELPHAPPSQFSSFGITVPVSTEAGTFLVMSNLQVSQLT